MIQVAKPTKPGKPKIGDILRCGEYIDEIELTPKQIVGKQIILPSSADIAKGLADLGIDAGEFINKSVYTCPWTGNVYYWVYPLGVLSNDAERYNCEPWNIHTIDANYQLNRIAVAMQGHGFTTMTLPSDGHGSRELGTVPLENGDLLLVACWVWFNK